MSSSDSEDDCYGNIAQKLKSIKKQFVQENVESQVSKDSELAKTGEKLSKTDENNTENTSVTEIEDCNVTLNSTDNDELTLDAIIANNSKPKSKRGRGRGRGRGAKRKSVEDDNNEPTERVTRASRRKTNNSARGRTSPISDPGPSVAPVEPNTSTASTSRGRGNSTRGRGSRGGNRGANATPCRRGRGRRNHRQYYDIFSSLHGLVSSQYPTYNVGDIDDYTDQCDNQQLFSSRTVNNDVEVIEETDPLDDDNEEMSVKVYWQSLEIYKFKIRKYQKLTQIFEFFTEKENVGRDKLLFTYNDRILKIDDTPETINYSIAKFIDGGIVNQNVSELIKDTRCDNVVNNNGLKIKFQCQNKKKPFETTLRPDDKLALAMTKCAEHLETPLERLKFYFDGDLISSKNTPQDLELEGGECIDVKICS